MPQYRIIFRTEDGDCREYIRYGKDEEEAQSFTPVVVIDGDFENPVPLQGELVSIEEMESWTVFQLDSDTYESVKSMAESLGLSAAKAVGAYCLEVRGKGDWMTEEWAKSYQVLTSNWRSDRPTS